MSQPTNERDFKGIWIPKEIYLNQSIPWSAKIIFLEIDSFTRNGKPCYVSNAYLSEFLGITETQVSRHISLLKELGWIVETGFDGRRRSLVSDVNAALTKSARQTESEAQGSIDENRNHTNTSTNTFTINKIKTKIGQQKFDDFPNEILRAREAAYLDEFCINNFNGDTARLDDALARLKSEYSYCEFKDMGHLKNTFKKLALNRRAVKPDKREAEGKLMNEAQNWFGRG